MANTRQGYGDMEPRLAAVEATLNKLAADVATLATGFRDSQRTPWSTLIAAVGLTVVILGAIGASWVSPIYVHLGVVNRDIAANDAHLQRKNQEIHTLERQLSAMDATMREKFREVESQMAWQGDLTNVRFQRQMLLMGLLWQKVYTQELPQPPLSTAGPNQGGRE